jgi:hypothetical protein
MPRPQFVRGLLALFPRGPKGSPFRATSGVDTLGSSAGLGAYCAREVRFAIGSEPAHRTRWDYDSSRSLNSG